MTLRGHLINMLGIIAENKDILRISRGSPDDKLIQAARKAVIDTRDGTMRASEIAMEEVKMEHG